MSAVRFILISLVIQLCFAENVFDGVLSDISIERIKDVFSNLWIQSMSATLLVSAAPVLVIFTIPDLKNHNNKLKVLLAFAAGGLLGDAFLHLIPHSIDPHDHKTIDHSHSHESHHGQSHRHGDSSSHGHSHGSHHGHGDSSSHGHSHDNHHEHSHSEHADHYALHDHSKNMIVGLWVVAGIMSFLCVEKFVRLMKGEQGHSHSLNSSPKVSDKNSAAFFRGDSHNPDTEVKQRKFKDKKIQKTNGKKTCKEESNIKVSGYLNLVADFAHNFTDGLAIGASFLVNKNVGIVTTITILFHELPHEIGDYAILIQSGCSRKKAILLQLVTAVGAIFGTGISLISQDAGTSSTWILPFTAGGFIYISTVSVIPELLQQHTKLSQTINEIMAMIVGVGMMIVIAYFE